MAGAGVLAHAEMLTGLGSVRINIAQKSPGAPNPGLVFTRTYSLPHRHIHLVDNIRLFDHYFCESGVSTTDRADGCFCGSG